MTLEEALRFAREHNPRLNVAQAELRQRQAEAQIPRASWMPSLGARAQAVVSTNNNSSSNWLGSSGAARFPRISGAAYVQDASDIHWNVYMSTAVGLGISQRVFDFGRAAAETAAADARAEATRAREIDVRFAIELSVRESYYASWAAKAVLVAAEDALRRSSLHRDETRARVAQGLRPRVELERVEADVARFEVGVIEALGGVTRAQAVFAAAVGVEQQHLDVAGEPAPIPALPSLQQALRAGREQAPALQATEAERRARKADANALAAQLRPELDLVGTVMGAAGGAPAQGRAKPAYGDGFLPWIPNYYLGLVLSWRYYDAPTAAQQRAAERGENVAALETTRLRRELRAEIEEAWIAVDVAERSLPGLLRALEASRANYAQAEARYQAGLASAVELADAEALRIDTEIRVALGRFQIARTRAQLARVIAEGN